MGREYHNNALLYIMTNKEAINMVGNFKMTANCLMSYKDRGVRDMAIFIYHMLDDSDMASKCVDYLLEQK